MDIHEQPRKNEDQTGRTGGRVKHDGQRRGARVLEVKGMTKSEGIATS
jgi:hypothetical protein